MWSSSLRTGVLCAALLATIVLSGCSSFRPVYGDYGTGAERIALNYAKPPGRLEQIIIQDLIVRLDSTDDPSAPVFNVAAAAVTRQMTHTGVVKPATNWEVIVDARYTISQGDTIVASGARRASANYTTSGQVLADEAALKDATERAGHAVADTIRLSILGSLSLPVGDTAAAQ